MNADLVTHEAEGKVYSVRHHQVNAMLLNEFLTAHRRLKEQDKRIEQLTARLDKQAVQIEKVSAQLRVSRPSAKVVVNSR